MKNFNVLLTCCSIHVKEMIDCLKNNEDGVDIKVYVANSVAANLPPAELSDGNFVVPPISAPNYVETLISLCKEYDVSIIMPTATLELEIMARAKDKFEQNGILVSVSSIDSLLVANNKIALYSCYAGLMPKQIIPESVSMWMLSPLCSSTKTALSVVKWTICAAVKASPLWMTRSAMIPLYSTSSEKTDTYPCLI